MNLSRSSRWRRTTSTASGASGSPSRPAPPAGYPFDRLHPQLGSRGLDIIIALVANLGGTSPPSPTLRSSGTRHHHRHHSQFGARKLSSRQPAEDQRPPVQETQRQAAAKLVKIIPGSCAAAKPAPQTRTHIYNTPSHGPGGCASSRRQKSFPGLA